MLPNSMSNGSGWVADTLGQWIHPESADTTQVDETAATGGLVTTITFAGPGGGTWVQTITKSTPSAGVARTVVSGWVKQ